MEHRHLTLMFTDIVGYSRLMGSNQEQTIAMLEDYRRILVEEIEKQQGTVIEFIGDAVFARFDTPLAGVTAAVAIQKALFSFNHFRDKTLPRLQTRIGLHAGEVATKDDAVFGDDVNIAARLEPIAVADGICVSEQVYKAVKDEIKEPVLSLGVQPLKNIQSKIRAYLIRPLGIGVRIRSHYLNRRFNEKVGAYRYAIAASVLLLIFAGIYYIPRWLVPGYDANYVEIADFTNLMNEGGESDYLSAGISEAVRAQLADMKDVYVLKAGEGVQAPLIIEGSVQKLGDNLRIAYQLKRRNGDVQIAGGKLDGKYGEIFILQDRVVGEIATYLADEFDIPNFRPARINTTSDILAYEYYMRGLEYLNKPNATNNSDQAIKFFTTALVHDSEFVDPKVGLCLAYRKKYIKTKNLSWLDSATIHCSEALRVQPSLIKAMNARAQIYNDRGEFEKTINTLSSLENTDSFNIEIAKTLSVAYYYSNQVDQAINVLHKAIDNDPNNWLGYHALGRIFLSSGRIDDAISIYKKTLIITPDNNTTLSNLGIAYSYKGELEEAVKVFRKAISIVPSSWAYSNLGSVSYFLGDYKNAKKYFITALNLTPDDYQLRVNYADTLRALKRNKESTKEYLHAIMIAKPYLEINPKDLDAIISLALANIALSKLEQAETLISKSIKIDPSNQDVLYAKLRYEVATNDYESSLLTLKNLLNRGYSKILIENDPDLSSIREKENYKELIAKL